MIIKTHLAAQPQYPISKAALNMVVAEFAAALAPEGFTVIAIAPGFVNTAIKPREGPLFALRLWMCAYLALRP